MCFRMAAATVQGISRQDDDVNFDAGFPKHGVTRHGLRMSAELYLPFAILEVDIVLEQEQQHSFFVVAKYHQVDVGVFACGAVQYRAGKVGVELCQQSHCSKGLLAELMQNARVTFLLVQNTV